MLNDTATHTYEIRWQLDSTSVTLAGPRAETIDPSAPNLAIIPFRTNGVAVSAVSGQLSPEVMGWKLVGTEFRRTTTLRHTRTLTGPQTFLTLLHPLRKGATANAVTFQEQNGIISLNTGDGRVLTIRPATQPGGSLIIDDAAFKDTDGDGIPDSVGDQVFHRSDQRAGDGAGGQRHQYVAGGLCSRP